jgi:branched-chain amino acid transport system ATP-binding protein
MHEATKLKVDQIHAYYGNIHALRGVSFEVAQGEIVTLIGNNGAGKSTLLNAISGLIRAKAGGVLLEGRRIDGLAPHKIVEAGISQVPEGRKIFSRLSVQENLEMGAFLRKDKAKISGDMEKTFQLFPRLRERLNQIAGTLSGGEQQMLAIGRALMAHPRILLLDEPSMGLAPILVDAIFDTIQQINREGTTILLVEQNALMAFQIAKRGYVLQTGKMVMQGETKELQNDNMIQNLYLGGEP